MSRAAPGRLEHLIASVIGPPLEWMSQNPLTVVAGCVLLFIAICSGKAWFEYRYPCVESHVEDATCWHYQTVRVGDQTNTISTPYPCKRTVCDRRVERP